MSTSPAGKSSSLTRCFALAGVAAAAMFAASTANAADCVNGYRTIGNDVIVLCDATANALNATALFEANPEAAAPVVSDPIAPRAAGRSMMAASAAECQAGQYWSFNLAESGSVLLRC